MEIPKTLHLARLFTKNKAKLAMCLLRAFGEKVGYAHPYELSSRTGYYFYHKSRERNALAHMHVLDWIETRNSGPRGGKRWHVTETGQLVLDIVSKAGPDYKVQFMLLFGRWK